MVEELVGAGSVTSEAAVLVVICPGCSPSRAGEFGRPVGSFTAEVPEAVIRYVFRAAAPDRDEQELQEFTWWCRDF